MSLSRLESLEKTRLLKQTGLFFGGGIGVILVFVFIVLPIFSKILAAANKQSMLPVSTPSTVLLTPTLSVPYNATNSASLTVSGTAQAGMSVLLGQNGSIDKKTTASADGSFSFDVTLNSGDNMFQAYIEDANGNRSDGSQATTVTYNTDAPKLEITSPQDGSTVSQRKQQVVTVTGTTDPQNKVYLNEQFLFVRSDGSFTGQFQLQPGGNAIHVKAVNVAGNETTKDINVTYSP